MARKASMGRHAGGFTFLGLLFLIALMGLMATVAASTWRFSVQRDKEFDLLFVGREYRAALGRYASAHAGQRQPWPTELSQLLGGTDRLVPVRYLRRLYFDPMTGSAQWGLVKTPEGGIIGVYSLSTRAPVRTSAAIGDEGIDFVKARSYRDWEFRASLAAGQGGLPGANPPGWNETENGAPPLTWENPPPTPVATPGEPN